MATLEENINQAISDFDDIEAAIEEVGGEVADGTNTSEYGNIIRGLAVTVDQSYNAESTNAQSGVAVAEALANSHIKYVESLDEENLLNLFDMESGTYILKGYFRPHPDATNHFTFSKGQLVGISKGAISTCVQVFYPPYNAIQYLNILPPDEEAGTGYTYERKDAKLYYMEDARNRVTAIDDTADDTHYPTAKAVYEFAKSTGLSIYYSPDANYPNSPEYDGMGTEAIETYGRELQVGDFIISAWDRGLYRVTAVDPSITQVEFVMSLKGDNGEDGYSPTVSLTNKSDYVLIEITDKESTKQATVYNGKDGANGADGKDGTSVTHSWDGTTLTVTSASGTSSADLKGETGEKGDTGATGEKGEKGDTGAKGADGTSVTVSSVSESAADGGSNVVTFSDGKSVTIKNGSKGTQGEKGEKGDTGATGEKGDTGESAPDARPIAATSTDGVAYTATAEGITSLYVGLRITIIPDRVSAALTPTLNLNGLGAKNVIMPIGGVNTSITTNAAKLPTWLGANNPVGLRYDGTRWKAEVQAQSAQYMYGKVPISGGGTGAETAEEALTNLGLTATAAEINYLEGASSNIQAQIDELRLLLGNLGIVGSVDGENNIILSGSLADGTYTLKYENEDGTTTDIGTLTVGEVAPAYTNLFDPAAATLNQRWSNSSFAWTTSSGTGYVVSDYIPVTLSTDTNNPTVMHFRGATYTGNAHTIFYNSSKTIINSTTASTNGAGMQVGTTAVTTDENGDYQVSLGYKNGTFDSAWTSGVAYMRVGLYVGSATLTSADIQNIIITVDELITD